MPRTLAFLILSVLSLAGPSPSRAEPRASQCATFPFALQIDMDTVRALAGTPPERLLAAIGRLGIDVLRVPDTRAASVRNPLLASLPMAGHRLLEQSAFLDSYQGRSIPHADPCCGLKRDTVLIRDDAPTYTLLHEVLHLLLVPSDGQALRADNELRFATALRRLVLYQRRLMDDPWRLLQPQWRTDILSAQRELATLLYDRIRIGQAQEAIVEQVLADCIDERNPYHDAQRRLDGHRYGIAMIDNAVDVFNSLHDSLVFCDETVAHLQRQLATAELELPPGPARLTAQDARDFAAAVQDSRALIERVRLEIEVLKRSYPREPRAGGSAPVKP